VKRDVDTVLTYPAVMGSVFLLALQVGVSLGLAVVAACVVVVLAAVKNRERANTSPGAYRVSGGEGRTYQSVANGLRADGIPT
jgi:predicted Kef-type K+ transport protein